jgi:hypothetical protein
MALKEWREYVEPLGIIAVVASISLLGYEVRQTRLAILGASYQARAAESAEDYRFFIDSPILPELTIKVESEGFEALSPDEQLRFRADVRQRKVTLDAYFYQYELGLLSDEYYEHILKPILAWYKELWEEHGLLTKENTRPSFKAAVEAAAAEARQRRNLEQS